MENPEKVTIENNAFIHHFVVIQGSGEVLIEEGCQIGPWVKISSWKSRTTRIGRYAYISAGATIEDGVSIGKGAIIEANAIVNKDIPDFAIVNESGEVIGSTKSLDALELLDPQLKTWYEEWQAG